MCYVKEEVEHLEDLDVDGRFKTDLKGTGGWTLDSTGPG
jgi:hypothetical protein